MKCFSELNPKSEAEKLLEAFENIRYSEEPIDENFLTDLINMFREIFGKNTDVYKKANKRYDKYLSKEEKDKSEEILSKTLEDKNIKAELKNPSAKTIEELDKKIDEVCKGNNIDEDIAAITKLKFYLSLAKTYETNEKTNEEFKKALQDKINDITTNNKKANELAIKIKKDAEAGIENRENQGEENAPSKEEVEDLKNHADKSSKILGGDNSKLQKFVDAFFSKIGGREGQDDGTYKLETKTINGYETIITEAIEKAWYNSDEIKPFRELLRNNKGNALDEKELKTQRDIFINFVASVESFMGNIGAKGKKTSDNETKWNFLVALLQNKEFRDILGYN